MKVSRSDPVVVMTPKEILKAKDDMNKAIEKLVEDFNNDTGFMVEQILLRYDRDNPEDLSRKTFKGINIIVRL